MRDLVVALLCLFAVVAEATEFDRPWADPDVALILDPFYGNTIDWMKLASEQRVVGIIHKATIGTRAMDSAYFQRRAEAKKRGYLWGSYHWGEAGDPIKQADYYVDMVKPAPDELIALDLEDATSTKLMNIQSAIRFVERVKERTGRYPVLYTNHASVKLIVNKYKETVLAKTPLWYARFKSRVTDFPSGLWPSYTLWQFSSEINPQLPIPGTRRDMDINVYNGTVEQLRAAWPLTKAAP